MAGVAGASRSAGAASAGSRRDHLSALPHTIFRRPKGRNMEGLGGTEGGDGGKGGGRYGSGGISATSPRLTTNDTVVPENRNF